MVFQNYALYPHMSAAKNMGFALRMRGLPKGEIDIRVREAAHILGLSDSLHKKPRTLSGGQRQRVAMGARSSVIRKRSSWTSRSRTSTQSCGWRCAPRSHGSSAISG